MALRRETVSLGSKSEVVLYHYTRERHVKYENCIYRQLNRTSNSTLIQLSRVR